MKPLMTQHEIRHIKKLLLSLGAKNSKVRVLEWGSGGSTVYFTQFLKRQNIPYVWRSVEYNKGWYEKVQQELSGDKNTRLALFDVGNRSLRQRNIPMEEYIKYPSTLGEAFDLIIVDGRKRRRCLLEADKILSPDGVVLLHDAQRKHYQCAFSVYRNHTFVGVYLWKGNNKKVGIIKKVFNKIQTSFFYLIYRVVVRPIQFIYSHLSLKYKLTKECLLQAEDFSTKIKILTSIFMLALKKRSIPIFNINMSLRLKPNIKKEIKLKKYKDAFQFYEDLLSL